MGYGVDPRAYGKSGETMAALAAAVLNTDGLNQALSGQSGMAGSDDAAATFAEGYDRAVPQALTAMHNIANSCESAAGLLWATGDNYAQADADSTPGGGQKDYPFIEPDGGEPLPPPCYASVLGGSGDDGPGGIAGQVWRLVEKYVGHVWPNGHQDRLRSVADAWSVAATQLGSHDNDISTVVGLIGQQESPEVPVATARIKGIGSDLDALASACADIARSCNEYAQHIDDAHSELITQLEEFALEAAAWEIGGIILTEVGGEIWANAALAGRLAELGGRLKSIIEAFITLVRTVGARLSGLLAKLAEILARVGAKITPGTSRVGHQEIENTLRGFLKDVVDDYDNGKLPPSIGQQKQLSKNFSRWENNVKGNVIDKRMKEVIEDDPFLREHLSVTPRFEKGPDIIVNNPGPAAPAWYDVTTSRMADKHLQDYASWGVGKILEWDRV